MKKLFLLFLLSANVQMLVKDNRIEISAGSMASAQHMYREAGDNCRISGLWYQVTDLCDDPTPALARCQYCGLYIGGTTSRTAHEKTCKYRPHIEFEYDDAGNRIERVITNYRLGHKVTACNTSVPAPSRRKDSDWSMHIKPFYFAIKSEEHKPEAKGRKNFA